MPKPKKGPRLGGSPAHQRLMLSNLATALFEHGRITTTETRARLLRPVAEKLITKAKRGDLHNRREVLKTVRDKSVVHTLFTEIAPTFAERPGGYTRITKIGPRKGDNAPMAVIELVTEAYSPKAPSTKKTEAAAAPAPAAEAASDEPRSRTPTVETEVPRRPRPPPPSTRLPPRSTRPPPRRRGCCRGARGRRRGSPRSRTTPRPDPRSATQARHPAGVAGLRASRRAVREAAGAEASSRSPEASRTPTRCVGGPAPGLVPLTAQRRARTSAASRLRGAPPVAARWRVAATTASLTGVGTPWRRPWSTTSPAR